MNIKKGLAIGVAAVMLLSTTIFGFAADYSHWDSVSVYPTDVVNTQYFTPVKYLVDKKVVSGYEDGKFYPEKTITRAEFARMIAVMTNNTGQMATAETKNYYNDLGNHQWAKGYINCCREAGLMVGKGADKFAPADKVSYVEVIATMIRSRNVSAVTTGTWPNNYIDYATRYLNPIVGDRGITDWNAPAKRGDVAMMMYRFYKKAEPTTPTAIVAPGVVGAL